MSLVSLCRSTRSTNKAVRAVSSDEFIDDALRYAMGANAPEANPTVHPITHNETSEPKPAESGPMRRATFTLSTECIAKLSHLSETSETSRSALIRHWITTQFDANT